MQTCEEWSAFFARLEMKLLYIDFQILKKSSKTDD